MCASEQQRRASTPCIQAGDQHRRLERPDTFFASPLCCFTAHRTLVSFVYVLFCGGFQAGPAWAILRLCSCCGLRAYIGGVRRADGKRVRKRESFLREGHEPNKRRAKERGSHGATSETMWKGRALLRPCWLPSQRTPPFPGAELLVTSAVFLGVVVIVLGIRRSDAPA